VAKPPISDGGRLSAPACQPTRPVVRRYAGFQEKRDELARRITELVATL